MFALFFSLYLAMFRGTWSLFTPYDIATQLTNPLNKIGEFLTSLFNNVNTPVTDLGTALVTSSGGIFPYQALIAFVLALITSIGIVVMAVKGVKKAFGIFFMGIR